jgi:pimeloyl-ACP methyl ester carboxylesterase
VIVTGLYIFCVIGLTLAQRKLIYHPCKSSAAQLEVAARKASFQIWRNSAGEAIGWFRAGQSRRSILLLHGNTGCAPDWFHYADGFQAVEAMDFYILEYPGYGGRKGKAKQEEILRAAENGFASITNKCAVYLVGESLGTGVAAYLAGKYGDGVRGIFLVAPYNNMMAVAKSHLPLFPIKLMLKDKYPASEWLQNFHGPVGVLLAEKDTTVPSDLGRDLFEKYAGPKKLWIEPGATHGNVHKPRSSLWKEVQDFWKEGKQ